MLPANCIDAIGTQKGKVLHSALQSLINRHPWDVPQLPARPAAVQLAIRLCNADAHWREI